MRHFAPFLSPILFVVLSALPAFAVEPAKSFAFVYSSGKYYVCKHIVSEEEAKEVDGKCTITATCVQLEKPSLFGDNMAEKTFTSLSADEPTVRLEGSNCTMDICDNLRSHRKNDWVDCLLHMHVE